MGFVTRLNFPELPVPARAYVHKDGYSFYGDDQAAADYFLHAYENYHKTFPASAHAFFLGALWANRDGELIVDYARLTKVNHDRWSDNAVWPSCSYIDGVWLPCELLCGDEIIMFGEEEKFRRTTRDLRDYAQRYPHLGDLEPTVTIISNLNKI